LWTIIPETKKKSVFFFEIGRTTGKEDLEDRLQNYFFDQSFEWKAYSRLKQLVVHGENEYSNTVYIENTNYNYRFELFPNPVNQNQALQVA
jgi:hypothetical protein